MSLFQKCPTVTSSMGRLFDAISSIINIRQEVNYEGQAAIELEAAVIHQGIKPYPVEFILPGEANKPVLIDPSPLIQGVVEDYRNGIAKSVIACKFHHSIKEIILDIAHRLRKQNGLRDIVLSGGVWQNIYLLNITQTALEQEGFKVITHHLVPANDGGISLGQAAIAYHRLWKSS
jgi:hydrogenase maturation protein HypF